MQEKRCFESSLRRRIFADIENNVANFSEHPEEITRTFYVRSRTDGIKSASEKKTVKTKIQEYFTYDGRSNTQFQSSQIAASASSMAKMCPWRGQEGGFSR